MNEIKNSRVESVEAVLKSDPDIRHLLDVACPLYKKNKLKIKAILLVCKSYSIRKATIDLLKSKLDIPSFNNLDLNMSTRDGDIITRITQAPEKKFVLCEEAELKLSESSRKMLARFIENSSFDVQIGKGPEAKSLSLDFPETTLVFSCEQKTTATDFLSKYCDHVIIIDDYKVEDFCEPLIAASFNEEKIECSVEILKSIALRNKKDVDRCLKSVRKISQFMELHECSERALTRSILNEVEGNIYHYFTLEYMRELKQLNMVGHKLVRLFKENEDAFERMELCEIMELLNDMHGLVIETMEALKSLPASDHFN